MFIVNSGAFLVDLIHFRFVSFSGDGERCQAHQLCRISQLQDCVSALRWPLLLHLCGCERQQPLLPGGHPQLCRGSQRVFPQCLRAGSGVQLLQGLHGGGRDVLGRRDPRDQPDEGPEAADHVQLTGVADPNIFPGTQLRDLGLPFICFIL